MCYINVMDASQERQTNKEWEPESIYGQVFADIERLAAEKEGDFTPQEAYELYEAHLAAK